MFESALRLQQVQLSAIRKVLEKAQELERAGKRIIHLEIGEPDFATPPSIVEAAKEALDKGYTHYGPNRGVRELRQAIAEKLERENGVKYNPDSEIIVTVGAAEALFDSIVAYLNPGDEVIIFEPAFINYAHCTRMAGGVPVFVQLREENGFQVDETELRRAITSKTRMIVINTPHNPTGAVLSQDSLRAIADVAREHDLLVISDEIYEKIIYGAKHYTIASFPGMKERTVTINGFSKAYAMTGWRLAYYAAAENLILPMLKIHQYTTTCAPTFIQLAAAKGMKHAEKDVEQMVAEFNRRRMHLVSTLNSIPGLTCVEPQGAFYVFLNVKQLGRPAEEVADLFLTEAGVAVVPGTAFGPSGEGYVRLSYATSYDRIVEAGERLRALVAKL